MVVVLWGVVCLGTDNEKNFANVTGFSCSYRLTLSVKFMHEDVVKMYAHFGGFPCIYESVL
jgi:hypothetical protein